MNQNLPVKILKDENDRPFVPFTTSDAVFINGTDDTIQDVVEGKQDTLVSGTNIKTINNESILGSGNIDIQGGGSSIQVSELPTASASELGKIYQYIGNDTADYKNGYFYKCIKETNIEHLTTTKDTSIPLDFALNNENYSVEIDLRLINLSRWYPDSNLMMGADDNYNSAIFISKTNEADINLHCGCGGSENVVFVFTKPEYRTTIHYNEYNNDYGSYICSFNTDEWIISGFNANNSNGNLTLFSSYGREGMLAELYSFKVYDNSTSEPTLIHNLVPRLNNGVPSLYDTVTQVYYADTSNTMTYTAGGDVYYWDRYDVQPGALKVCKIPWENNIKISDTETLRDIQKILDNWLINEKITPYMIDNMLLHNIYLASSDEWSDYKEYRLQFSGVKLDNALLVGDVIIYTHYTNNNIYDDTNEYYYPRFGYKNQSELAYNYTFNNYLSKDNTGEYIPQDDYNPATKAYVDSVKNYALLQYNEMPEPNKVGDLVQYKGITNNNYKHSSFYKSKASSLLSPVLKVNTSSSFVLGYQYQSTDRLEIKFISTSDSNDHGVLGNEEGNYSYMEMHFNSGIFYIGTGEVETSYSGYYEPNKTYTVKANVGETNDIIINGETVNTSVTFSSNGTLKLFDYNGNTDYRGNFYYLRIYDRTTGNLKKEWVPALDQNDVPCIYETVGQTYIYNTYDNTGNQYDEVADSYVWELETEYLRPEVITNSNATYTIANLKEHQLYNLGEITALTITAINTLYLESNIFLESGATPTTVSLPSSIENIGDAPTMTTASSVNTGTLTANKKYIISFLNGVAVWKEY